MLTATLVTKPKFPHQLLFPQNLQARTHSFLDQVEVQAFTCKVASSKILAFSEILFLDKEGSIVSTIGSVYTLLKISRRI